VMVTKSRPVDSSQPRPMQARTVAVEVTHSLSSGCR